MNWFEQLTGFQELDYAGTQAQFELDGDRLRSRVNGRSWGVGRLETPSLATLRDRFESVREGLQGELRVHPIEADVHELHKQPAFHGAWFQVASQFNLLEMPSDSVSPEDGVSGYENDHTQGPACARAAGAATLYRNYFVPVDGQPGQTRTRQIDTLRPLRAALPQAGDVVMRNGYVRTTERVLKALHTHLSAQSETQRDALRGLLQIGLHHGVEVTAPGAPSGQRVSQAFCSALPIHYNPGTRPALWAPWARLVLEAAYEATLLAALVHADPATAKPQVLLTALGGGAFGNAPSWIDAAMHRALKRVQGHALTVWLVRYPGSKAA